MDNQKTTRDAARLLCHRTKNGKAINWALNDVWGVYKFLMSRQLCKEYSKLLNTSTVPQRTLPSRCKLTVLTLRLIAFALSNHEKNLTAVAARQTSKCTYVFGRMPITAGASPKFSLNCNRYRGVSSCRCQCKRT